MSKSNNNKTSKKTSERLINLKKTTKVFYPDLGSTSFVYLTSLFEEESEEAKAIGKAALGILKQKRDSFSEGSERFKSAYVNLQNLVTKERAAETLFIENRLGGAKEILNQIEKGNYKPLIDAFNEILSFSTTYKTNIQKLKQGVADQSTSIQIDYLYSLTNFTLRSTIIRTIEKVIGTDIQGFFENKYTNLIISECAKAVTKTIKNAYKEGRISENSNAKDDNRKLYTEFATEIVDKLRSNSELVRSILENYGISEKILKKTIEQANQKAKKTNIAPTIKLNDLAYSKRGGNVFEDFVNATLNQITTTFNAKTFSTGALNNMKADHIVVVNYKKFMKTLEKAIKEREEIEKSVRIKNIEALETALSTAFKETKETKEDIIFISDKSYQLSFKNFQGFQAESPSLRNLGKVLAKAQINGDIINDLIFVLANTGNLRLLSSTETIERYLAQQIGNFLFDDVVITEQLSAMAPGANRVHVFNLGNIYIPLSFMLEGVLKGIKSIEYTNFVKVHYSEAPIAYTEQTDGLELTDWNQLYEDVIDKSYVSFHFLKNFVDFIASTF